MQTNRLNLRTRCVGMMSSTGYILIWLDFEEQIKRFRRSYIRKRARLEQRTHLHRRRKKEDARCYSQRKQPGRDGAAGEGFCRRTDSSAHS